MIFSQPGRNRHATGQDALVLGVSVDALVAGDDLNILLVRVRGVHGEGRDVLVTAHGLGAVLADGTRVNGGGDGVVTRVRTVLEEGAANLATVGGDGFGAGELLRSEGVVRKLTAQGRGVLSVSQVFLSQGGVDRCQSVDGFGGRVFVPVAGGSGRHVGEGCEGRHGLHTGFYAGGSVGQSVRGGGRREAGRQAGAGDGGGQCRGGCNGNAAAKCRALGRVRRAIPLGGLYLVFGCSHAHAFFFRSCRLV